jgi:hydroxymethylbilane synthase
VAALPSGALVGTSSLRRRAQLSALRPDLRFADLRGNVETRLRKLREGAVAATVLAMAGLARLGLLRQAGAVPLDPEAECAPAPGQGAVAVECRADDRRAAALLAACHHRPSARAVTLERALLAFLEGGCSLPLGCLARRLPDGNWRLTASLGTPDGLRRAAADGAWTGLAERVCAALRC